MLSFVDLFVEFCFCVAVTISTGLSCELGIHRGEFVGFTFNGQLEASAEDLLLLLCIELGWIVNLQFGMEEPEVGKGVLSFLSSGIAKKLG